MKDLMTYAANSKAPPSPEQMAAIGKFGREMTEAGVLLMTGGLVRPTKGTRIGMAAGKFTVTDGPFAETKELIDGFALIRADSMAEGARARQAFHGHCR
jgi:hypothetical protein